MIPFLKPMFLYRAAKPDLLSPLIGIGRPGVSNVSVKAAAKDGDPIGLSA